MEADLRRIQRSALTGLLALMLAGAAVAASPSDLLQINGFVSQGYLNTWDNNYLIPRSVNGSAEFTEAAITVVAQPQDKLRVGIQLLARNFGDTGNGFVSVDWAYGDYRWRDWMGVRAGKVKMPFGFYNEGRDVDMLRTSIFLPQSIYNETMRDFILAYEGVGIYGNVSLGSWGEGDYHVFGGTLNVPDPTRGFWADVYNSAGVLLEDEISELISEDLGAPATATFYQNTDQVVSFPWIYGGGITWDTPLEGLRLGASGLQGRFNFQGNVRYDVLVDRGAGSLEYLPATLRMDETTKINHIAVFGAEYLRDSWGLASEYYHEDIGNGTRYGWYAQVDWQAADRWALGAYYSIGQGDDDDFEGVGLPDYYEWQKDLTLSLRIDLTDHWLFKVEHHTIDGVGGVSWDSLEEEISDPREQHWGMFSAKTTFHF
ncbi:MAG: hypothetical protein ACI9UK_001694 [Candidatus Krumholzibacteriia bacterium]|jgi:hypothetical protein